MLDERCRTKCRYYSRTTDTCDYFLILLDLDPSRPDHRRGCPSGEDCTRFDNSKLNRVSLGIVNACRPETHIKYYQTFSGELIPLIPARKKERKNVHMS